MRLRILFAPFLLAILFAFMFMLSITQLQAKEEVTLTAQAHSENVESVIHTANQSQSACDDSSVPDGVGDGAVPYTDLTITADYVRDAICTAYLRDHQKYIGALVPNKEGQTEVDSWPNELGEDTIYQVQYFDGNSPDNPNHNAVIIFNPRVRAAFVVRHGILQQYNNMNDPGNGPASWLGGPINDEMRVPDGEEDWVDDDGNYGQVSYFENGAIVWWSEDNHIEVRSYNDETEFRHGEELQEFVPTFRDVPTNHAFFEHIEDISDEDITMGCISGQQENRVFCPESPITREQLALMLARIIYGMDDENLPDYSDPKFEDSNSDEFSRAAETLARDGIVVGYQNSNGQQVFGYDESATRGQAIAMTIKALNLPDNEVPSHPFTDIGNSNFMTQTAIAYHYGITSGYSDQTFRPDKHATRGASAKFLCVAFLHGCRARRSNELRQNSWVYASPGIRIRGNEQQDVRMAVASLDNPYVQIEVADDHNTGNSFIRHTLPELTQDHSSARNDGNFLPFIAINGTAFECDGTSAGSILRTSDVYITSTASSFFRYVQPTSLHSERYDIFSIYDERRICGNEDNPLSCQSNTDGDYPWSEESEDKTESAVESLVDESTFSAGFSAWNTIVYNGNPIINHPQAEINFGGNQKTSLGLSEDKTHIFMATSEADISLEQLAQQLIDAGAHQAILLDGGGSSQFESFGSNTNISQLREEPAACVGEWLGSFFNEEPRHIINAIVAYYGQSERVRNWVIIPDGGGSFPTWDGITFGFNVYARQPTFNSNRSDTITLHYAPQPRSTTYSLQDIGRFYEVSATYTDGSPAIPQDTYTTTVNYNPHRLPSNVPEANLALYFWNGSEWEREPTSIVNTDEDQVVATPNKFGFWAVFAPASLEQLTTNTPSYAGPHNEPSKIIIHVTKPALSLTKDDFSVTVDGRVASIITLHEGSDEYVLEVLPPTQSANGLYDLDVSVTAGGVTLSDLEQDAVLYSEGNNIDVALVIDRSGSMGTDYMQSAQNAAKQFVDFMFDNDQVGVVSFSNSARVDFGLAPVTSGAGGSREQAKNAIDALTSGGGTSIGGGLEQGQNELTSKGAATHPWAMVLLSDGAQNQEPLVADVLPDIVTTKTIVHTVALGPQSDQALLLDIATQTGGTYNLAPTAEQLQEVYNTIAGTVSGQQALLTQTGIVRTGETDEKSVVVDSTISEATFSVRWSNSASNLELELTAPDGTVINPTVSASTSDMVYVSGSTYAYYRIKSPTLSAGVWKMKITGGIISGSRAGIHSADPEEQYTAEVTGQPTGAAVTINSYFDDGTTYQTDDPILVSITLSDDQPILGAEVVAIVGPLLTGSSPARTTDQQSDPIMVLYDDGAHGDGQANDGVYGNVLLGDSTATPGLYSFQIFATGTANNGESFARRTQQNVNVGVSQNPISANRQAEGLSLFLPLIMD